MSGDQKIIALQLICTNTNCFYKIIVAKLLAFLRISTIFTLYRVYQKKVDNFETALNLAKRLQV